MKSIFSEKGRWYKGNLHTHSAESDGWIAPLNVFKAYKSMGYDFVCLTDHWKVTPTPEKIPGGVLHIPGVELDGGASGVGDYHLIGVDVRPDSVFMKPGDPEALSPGDMAAMIQKAGGLAAVAHPSWNGVTAGDLEDVAGELFALEVWNTGCEFEIGRGLAEVQWNDLLSRGKAINAIAVDDAHKYYVDAGKGWVMVRANALSPKAIRDALARGDYYSSTGPEILNVRFDEKSVRVDCGPAARIYLISSPRNGDVKIAREGYPLTGAVFELDDEKDYAYFRVRVTDAAGRAAWTNPFYPAE